jgi:hypothetical protein
MVDRLFTITNLNKTMKHKSYEKNSNTLRIRHNRNSAISNFAHSANEPKDDYLFELERAIVFVAIANNRDHANRDQRNNSERSESIRLAAATKKGP